MTITASSFESIYDLILDHMLDYAELYGKMKVIEDLHFTLLEPHRSLIPIRKNWAWALHEGINRLSFESPELQNPGTAFRYRPNWKKKLEKEGGKFCYSYGNFYDVQVPKIIKKLKSKSEREAIISIWNVTHLNENMERRPCTLTLHFYYFKNRLNCHCNMRTSDVMNLLPYDVFHHTLLQRYIATELKAELGSFHFTASFAYYQKKRDITGSVKNTLETLRNSPPIKYENEWHFSWNDRIQLSNLTNSLHQNYLDDINLAYSDFPQGDYTKFGHNYAKALIYLYYKKQGKKSPMEVNNELGVIYL